MGICAASSPSAGSTPAHLDDHLRKSVVLMDGVDDCDDGVYLKAGGLWKQDCHPAAVRMQLKPRNWPSCSYELCQLGRQRP